MPEAYLTIDDGPSDVFLDLVGFLEERNVPAIFFNRGDLMEKKPDDVVQAIKKGFVIANHAYSHRRFSGLPLESCFEEITRTEKIINDLYKTAGKPRDKKYFRFPYMDRGMGPWLVEPEHLPEEHKQPHLDLLESGLGHKPEEPVLCQIHKKRALQNFLKEEGFHSLLGNKVTLSWYAETELASAVDVLCTYSTSDWAISERHKGKHGFETIDDLEHKIDQDLWLKNADSAHIILAHDQAKIHDATKELINHFLGKGFTFLDF